MVVSVEATSSFSRGTPRTLFEGSYVQAVGHTYDVAPDGRCLMIKSGGDEVAPPWQITVVLHWDQELLERVPIP